MDYNQATVTTKYVTDNKSKVVYAVHTKEGWQFYGSEKDIAENDIRIISLNNILEINPHVKDILWLTEGMEAWINENKEEWQTGIALLEE
jgi:hypothetical protein